MNEITKALTDLKYDQNTEIFYVQEEHINFASFEWSKMHLKRIMKRLGNSNPTVNYIGRHSESTIATASSKDFKATDEKLISHFKNEIGVKAKN